LFAAGLLIHIPLIFAQEIDSAETSGTAESQIEVRDPYSGERDLFLDASDSIDAASGQAGRQSIWPIIRMILVLVLVAVAIYGIIFILKKSSKKNVNNNPFLKVLANAHLGTNRYVHIVSVGSKAWLLGASDGGVNLISEIEDKEIIDAMLLEDSAKSSQSSGKLLDFLSILRRFGAPVQSNPSGTENIRKFRERLGNR